MESAELGKIIGDLRIIGTDKQRIEVKSGIGKDARATLSAFSNANGGILIVGVSEADGFAPVPNFDARVSQDQLEQRCAQLSPPVRPNIDLVPLEDVVVLVAEVKELSSIDKPCYVTDQGQYNGSYIRTGDGDTRLTKYEVDRLLEEKVQPKWDEEPVAEASMSDVDDGVLAAYLRLQEERRPKTFAQGKDTALRRLRLARQGSPTLASLLVMGDYPQEFYPRLCVTFALFPGTRKGEITEGQRLLDSETITGNIPELVSQALAVVKRNMRTGAMIEGAFRRDVPDYPEIAVREAVVNALMHRDYSPYSLGSPVQINMFVDRLEISSPGGLYGGVTVNNLGEPGVSSTRNQRIATLLEDVRFPGGGAVAENRGTGIDAMRNALAKALMPEPVYTNTLNSFTVTFSRRRVAPQERYGTARDVVQGHLESMVSASTAELVAATKLSRSSVLNSLNSLIEEGVVERTEPSRSPKQRYRLRI
ncbi:ATP-binding protein [Corynebacterium senegalense]|uniref:ATP-binding protein n=1 Tax=Corynebacterium senegalense TaxID=2080750 RepID=UPI000E20C3A5|nr:ATP-binding protein [Corynebacterium senegalense]